MTAKTRRLVADLMLAAFTIVGAAILLIGAMDLPPPRFEPLGSAALPRILATILILFALIVALRAMRIYQRDEPIAPVDPAVAQPDPKKGALVLGALLLYVFSLDFLSIPFLIVTPVFVTVTGLVIGNRSWRNAVAFAILGITLALVISTVLERFLYIRIG